ncbi:MAG TPA: M14 family metallopeptidase [Bacillota bacterium]|nr:carboxypeptidase [Candidatus Fermentithermobacillaceae bacterium]HOB30031.1 M14 family metallopeptidase [Bacillota bacterium]HOK63921.1 M14 family metallopeptidase [Bacillota bacterium]HOL11276.1 M14 family metallopeptidase [Bacillota bacterium]HOQ02405.1 M14 family metallopeptidase [Bacillota bacterium]
MSITFDKYHTYQEIEDFLKSCISEHPNLCNLETVGKSFQGRDIWMLEVTNKETGSAKDKPGVYLDGNIHAGEVAGCETVLWIIDHLLNSYGNDNAITYLLDTQAFFFIPRIAADGAEYYLSTPHTVRSSLREWPEDYDEKPGLYPEDIDGNGKILTMRVRDPNGAWKISSKDPRLMIRREPNDLPLDGVSYYNVYREGLIREYDKDLPVKDAPPKYGLDFNRNFPTNWAVKTRQPGSGDYPFSEPELKAIADFFVSHPNIVLSMSYHTTGGYILRPFCTQRDSAMDPKDLQVYCTIGQIGEEITGYPCKSIFEWFTQDQTRPSVGSALEWFYETLGILSFATELWDMNGRAGLPKRPSHQYLSMSHKQLEEEGLALLRWNDEVMGGQLFVNWQKFDHPQLGEVEIGGWEPKFGRQNPPISLLEEECRKNGLFALEMAKSAPRIGIDKVNVECTEGDLHKIEVVVTNEGYLPTHGTFNALKMNAVRPVKVKIDPVVNPAQRENGQGGIEIVSGKAEQDLGHLDGYLAGNDRKKKASWMVRGRPGSTVNIIVTSGRAGSATTTIEL